MNKFFDIDWWIIEYSKLLEHREKIVKQMLREMNKKKLPEYQNKFSTVRGFSDWLIQSDFNEKDIILFSILTADIVKKSEGSLDNILLALHIENERLKSKKSKRENI